MPKLELTGNAWFVAFAFATVSYMGLKLSPVVSRFFNRGLLVSLQSGASFKNATARSIAPSATASARVPVSRLRAAASSDTARFPSATVMSAMMSMNTMARMSAIPASGFPAWSTRRARDRRRIMSYAPCRMTMSVTMLTGVSLLDTPLTLTVTSTRRTSARSDALSGVAVSCPPLRSSAS